MQYMAKNKRQNEQTANPSKYPQKRFNPKPCRKCGIVFEPIAPSHLYCSDDCADYSLTSRYLERKYDITYQDYLDLNKTQNSKCAICGGKGFRMAEHHQLYLVVDHCHETGKVRGLLCHNCNRGLGLFQDSEESLSKAIDYLEGATTIPKGSRA